MKIKRVISIFLSLTLIIYCISGMGFSAKATNTITYNTNGGSAISPTTATTISTLTGFRVNWEKSSGWFCPANGEIYRQTGIGNYLGQYYVNIEEGTESVSTGYVDYAFDYNYLHADNNALIMSAWKPQTISGDCDGSFYVYTAGDRQYTSNLLSIAIDKDRAVQPITQKASNVQSSTYSGWVNCGGFFQTELIFVIILKPVSVSDPKYVYTDKAVVTSEIPTKDGYDFAGWVDENGNTYSAGQEVIDSSLTLTAQWVSHVHKYTHSRTAPTCTTQGYTTHTCACGYSYVDNYVEPRHKFNDVSISSLPLNGSSGVRKFTCTSCGYTNNQRYYGVDSFLEVQYGSDPVRQSLNLFLPSDSNGDCSLILNIHGGAWMSGSKDSYVENDLQECILYGIATADINYRYISESVTAYDILDDIDAALTKIKEIGASKGLNITKVMLNGISAGAHLCLLYAYSRYDTAPITPVCVFDRCGPTNMLNDEYALSNIGAEGIQMMFTYLSGKTFDWYDRYSSKAELLAVSPINYVNSGTVPTVICHGMNDATVPFSESYTLDSLLSEYAVQHNFIAFPNSDHSLEDDTDSENYAKLLYLEYLGEFLFDDVPQANHHYNSTVTNPTCSTQGYTTHTCSACGDSYIDNYVDASHTPGEWEVVTPATTTTEGEKVKKCTVCGEIAETAVIEKIKEFKAKDGAPITIDETDMTISGVPQGTTDLSEYLQADGYELEYVETDAGFGTGTVLRVKLNGELFKSYTIIISGDVTGDGYVDSFDVAQASYYINSFEEPESNITMKAMDMCKDGYLDASDMAYIIYIANYME